MKGCEKMNILACFVTCIFFYGNAIFGDLYPSHVSLIPKISNNEIKDYCEFKIHFLKNLMDNKYNQNIQIQIYLRAQLDAYQEIHNLLE